MFWLVASACAAEHCEPVPGAHALLRPGVIVLLGEIHGTQQAPAAAAQIACAALDESLRVTVGLEIPQSEKQRFEDYLASDGSPSDQAQLIASDFWQRDYQDGRGSQAMLHLAEALRDMRQRTQRLDVLLIDNPIAPQGRDRFMAQWLKIAADADPTRMFVTLTGNVHGRLTSFDDRSGPMGFELTRLLPEAEIASIEITHGGGTAWVCTPDGCGVVRLRGDPAVSPGIELFPDVTEDGFSGRWHVGDIDASPPAKQR